MSEPQPMQGAEGNGSNGNGPASLAAAGARLAQLREAKGWSLEDVSARLKVAPPKLRALEAGDISPMPGTAFALGVVRSYAKMLGVDPEPFAQALRREHGMPSVDLSMPASAGTDLPRGRVSISLGGAPRHRPWLWAVAAVVAIIVAAVIWAMSGGSSNWLARFKQAGGASEAAVDAASATVADAASAAQLTTASEGVPVVAPLGASPTAVAVSASAPAASAALPDAPAIEAASAALASAAAATPAASAAQAAPAAAPASSVTPAAGQSLVELKVTQDSWFGVRDKDGKAVFSGLVHAGSAQQVAAAAPLKITIGNKAGLEAITVDGKPVDPAKYAAARGNVARFTLP